MAVDGREQSRWCRSCGADPAVPATTGAPAGCAACGTPLDPPTFGPARVGHVVVRGSRLVARHAIAVGESDGTVLLLEKGETPVAVPAAEFDQLRRIEVGPPGIGGAPGRLWAVELARVAGALKAKWSPPAVEAAATRLATQTLGARRGAALDLIVLGQLDRADLDLPASELAWYRARAAASAGDAPGLVRHLGALPATGYAVRVNLLLAAFAELRRDRGAAEAAVALLEPFAARSVDARALRAALRITPPPDAVRVLGEYARHAGVGQEVADGIRTLGRLPGPAGDAGAAVRALQVYLDGMAGESVDGSLGALGPLPIALLERLLAGGVLARIPTPSSRLPDRTLAYVRYRLRPGDIDDATLATAGLVAERARRAYLAGDDELLSRLPKGDEAVRHYRALRAYAMARDLRGDDLRGDARETVKLTDEMSMAFVVARPAPEQIAADPSTWPYLAPNAVAGRITADDRIRERFPRFGRWLDLCRLHRLLQQGQWNAAVEAGDRIAGQAAPPHTRAAALNVAAYAHWQLGRPEQALALLDEALAMRPIPGLAVNAALVAESQGRFAALPYLARVSQLADGDQLRHNAVARAIALWQADGADALPAILVHLVRGELTRPHDDRLHHLLLALAVQHDRPWLAGAAVTSTGTLQSRTTRYYKRRAGLEDGRTTAALTHAAAALAAVWQLDPRPGWAEDERRWLTGCLVDALRGPYNEGANPVTAVEALVEHGVFDLALGLQIATWAAVYLAVGLEPQGRALPPKTEERLLFAQVRTLRRQRGELGGDEQAVVGFMADRITNATVTIVNLTISFTAMLSKRWRDLDRGPAANYAAGKRIRDDKGMLVTELEGYVRRCRRYQQLADGLPVDEKVWTDIGQRIDECTELATRLRRYLS